MKAGHSKHGNVHGRHWCVSKPKGNGRAGNKRARQAAKRDVKERRAG